MVFEHIVNEGFKNKKERCKMITKVQNINFRNYSNKSSESKSPENTRFISQPQFDSVCFKGIESKGEELVELLPKIVQLFEKFLADAAPEGKGIYYANERCGNFRILYNEDVKWGIPGFKKNLGDGIEVGIENMEGSPILYLKRDSEELVNVNPKDSPENWDTNTIDLLKKYLPKFLTKDS